MLILHNGNSFIYSFQMQTSSANILYFQKYFLCPNIIIIQSVFIILLSFHQYEQLPPLQLCEPEHWLLLEQELPRAKQLPPEQYLLYEQLLSLIHSRHWYPLQLLPFLRNNPRIRSAVIVFIDKLMIIY